MTLKKEFGLALIGSWIVSVVAAFWWFEYRHWRAFTDEIILFSSSNLPALYHRLTVPTGKPLVVHFSRPECPCNRYQTAHIKKLQPLLSGFKQVEIPSDHPLVSAIDIPAAPAVAVWNGHGEVAYFGPYSSGAVCGLGTDFVSYVINKMRQHENPAWVNTVGVGCYCHWREV